MRFTTQLLPSRSGNLGIILLNNPKPLHALSLEMVHAFQDVFQQWHKDDSMAAILIKSSPETKVPAFCAGGDVKSVYFSGVKDPGTHGQGLPGLNTAEFFRQEYFVNNMMATSAKPQISIWNGITMGGGVGISVHGKYRVATENTVFAMPETAIGLFPDVGSLYWMTRLLPSDGLGVFMALSGHRLKPDDLLYTGLATHYVPSERLEDLEAALVMASKSLKPTGTVEDVVAPVLMSFHQDLDTTSCYLARERKTIDNIFGVLSKPGSQVEDIVADLKADNSEFSRKTLDKLAKMSPTSLKVTLEGLKRSAACKSLQEDLEMEFRLSQAFMRPGSDFYEGIRAVLVDKDHNTRWNPSSLESVTAEMVESYFEPIEHEWGLDTFTSTSRL